VTEGSRAVGKTLYKLGQELEHADGQVIGLVRNDVRVAVPNPHRVLYAGDILVIEAEPESLAEALSQSGLTLEEAVPAATSEAAGDETDSGGTEAEAKAEAIQEEARKKSDARTDADYEVVLMELAVRPDGLVVGRSASDIELRTRFGINLLALSRQGRRSIRRLRSERVQAGDVLLMQGPPDSILAFANEFGCVPLAERALRLPARREATIATAVMGAAIAAAAFGLLPAATAFAAGVLVSMTLRVVSPRTVYDAVDWPIVVLLAALIPVAGAMATTGAADLIARLLMTYVAQGHAVLSLTLILVVTMTLSDFMNNAATAAVMCPIALSVATQLDAQPDAFLMAVAIGASCAFLTPIGHQNNTLILGPGGFRFGDYWRLGLPLEVIVVSTSVPLLLYVWPL
jgi:di/tricarboxylate transporter